MLQVRTPVGGEYFYNKKYDPEPLPAFVEVKDK
jgi:hypothetical protein